MKEFYIAEYRRKIIPALQVEFALLAASIVVIFSAIQTVPADEAYVMVMLFCVFTCALYIGTLTLYVILMPLAVGLLCRKPHVWLGWWLSHIAAAFTLSWDSFSLVRSAFSL